MTRRFAAALLALGLTFGCVAPEQEPAPQLAREPQQAGPVVGGAVLDPGQTLQQNLSRSGDHRRLVSAINGAGAGQLLSGAGPYTVFAATDTAFSQLPAGTLEALMHPRSRTELAGLVNYHIVPGAKTRAQIEADVTYGRGSASYRTQQGATLRVTLEGDRIVLGDLNGRRSYVTVPDVRSSNGILHVVNNVLLPPLS